MGVISRINIVFAMEAIADIRDQPKPFLERFDPSLVDPIFSGNNVGKEGAVVVDKGDQEPEKEGLSKLENSMDELSIKKKWKYCEFGQTPFHLACGNGQVDLAEMIMKNSAEFNIDLNNKDDNGETAFHVACYNGHSKIAKMI